MAFYQDPPSLENQFVSDSLLQEHLARTLPQLPRLVHQSLTREPAADLQPQFERLIAVQQQQNRWLAIIALLLATVIGLLLA